MYSERYLNSLGRRALRTLYLDLENERAYWESVGKSSKAAECSRLSASVLERLKRDRRVGVDVII